MPRIPDPPLHAAAAAALLLVALSAQAGASEQSMRCDRTFIRVGDAAYQVLDACGEPRYREQVSGEDGLKVEHWVYPSDWSRFDRLVVLVAGRVKRIERLDD